MEAISDEKINSLDAFFTPTDNDSHLFDSVCSLQNWRVRERLKDMNVYIDGTMFGKSALKTYSVAINNAKA